MTTTQMDQLVPPPPVTTPPLTAPRPQAPAFAGVFRTPERRWWTIALTAVVLIAALAIGLLYVDDTNNQATIRSLQTKNESLTGRNQNLNGQLTQTQANLTATLGELATTKAELAHPHLVIWNVPQTLSDSGAYLAGGVPDTFTYHLQATSTGPMNVSIMTLEEFAKAIDCVHLGYGVTNYCMHHYATPVWSSLNTTSVKYDFHLAEGCADYLAVFTAGSKVTVTPNVSVTYSPAVNATGTCA